MNVERLKAVAAAVVADQKQSDFLRLFAVVESSYTQSFSSPSPANAKAFEDAIQALRSATAYGECAKLSAPDQRVLERIGGPDLCGPALTERVETVIREATNPSAALEQLQTLRAKAQAFVSTVTSLDQSLTGLGVEALPLPTDSAEVNVALPEELIDTDLKRFAKETEKLERALADIIEVSSGKREPITLVGLGSGSFDIAVSLDLASGTALIILLKEIVSLINNVMQTRKTKRELEAQQAPADVLKRLEEWEKKRIGEALQQLGDGLIKSYDGQTTRKQELRNALAASLKYLADRIDRGMDIDVVVAPPPEEPAGDTQPADTEDEKARQNRRTISENAGAVSRLQRVGEPVLQLSPPDPLDEDIRSSETEGETKKKK